MSNTKTKPSVRGAIQLSEDAHSRVAVLFAMARPSKDDKPILMAVSVKWLLTQGIPIDPETGRPMAYHGTHIIQ